jgi:hypothetical protein
MVSGILRELKKIFMIYKLIQLYYFSTYTVCHIHIHTLVNSAIYYFDQLLSRNSIFITIFILSTVSEMNSLNSYKTETHKITKCKSHEGLKLL